MTRSPGKPSCSFDNRSLKRWLLKIGPSRRISLLKKFKESLVDLGLPRLAIRKGLLQLASHPFVQLNRLATTQKKPKNRMRGPKSKRHLGPTSCSGEKDSTLDHNNNSNDFMGQEYIPSTIASCSMRDSQDGKHDRSDKSDHSIASPENTDSSTLARLEKKPREKRSKSRERRSTSRSRSRSKTEIKTHRSNSKRLDPGENRNKIPWQLIPIDMTNVRKPSNYGSEIRKQQREEAAKKYRLRAKFREIFGDEEEPELLTPEASKSETSKDAKTRVELEFISRKSPVFCDVSRKRKRQQDRNGMKKTKKLSQTKDCNANVTVVDLISSDSFPDTATTVFKEDIAGVPDQISTTIAASQSADVSDTSGVQWNTTDTAPQNADRATSDSKLDLDTEKPSGGSGFFDWSTFVALPGNEAGNEIRSDPSVTSQAASEVIPGFGIEMNHVAESSQKLESTDSKPLMDSLPQVTARTHTPVSLKHEAVDPPSDRYEETLRVTKQEDRSDDPSSTTDTLPSFRVSCINDRLPVALDNICLALHCIRRVDERQKTANKLAVEQMRHQELLKANRELKSEMIVFRKELLYLFVELGTWQAVLRFIRKGLEHRTSPDTRPFGESEIEAAMKDADVKLIYNKGKQEESPQAVHIPDMRENIIFEIDLTEDNECDSSTDPPKATYIKLDSDVESEDTMVLEDLSTPSIAEVRSISPQQFETIGESPLPPISEAIFPCFVCSLPSLVACGRCTKATYCTKKCQEFDWTRSHHTTCVPSEALKRYIK